VPIFSILSHTCFFMVYYYHFSVFLFIYFLILSLFSNLGFLVYFGEGGKPENLEKNSTHSWLRVWESNPGHKRIFFCIFDLISGTCFIAYVTTDGPSVRCEELSFFLIVFFFFLLLCDRSAKRDWIRETWLSSCSRWRCCVTTFEFIDRFSLSRNKK